MPIYEVFGDPDLDPIPIAVRSGDLVHANRILGLDAKTGELPGDINIQMRNAYANMRRCIENAGGSMDNVAHVSIFFADFGRDREAMNPAWVEAFPKDDDRPTYKFMPAKLPEGHMVQMEFHAVLGQRRELLAVKGVAHTNPIPLGVKMGPYVFSSRMLPYDPSTEKAAEGPEAQAEFLFQNTDALLKAGGRSWRDVWQGRAFLADPAHRSLMESRWQGRFPDPAKRPPLNRVRYGGGALQVMLEVFAVGA
jgi:2-iminobutanoate/2-iminopropanoate deaminase